MNARRREPIERCANDDTAQTQGDETVAVIGRLMQQLSAAIDPRNEESTSERLNRLVAGLTDEERTIFFEAVYGNPTSREHIEDIKKRK